MPVHDWTRMDAGIFHAFHLGWIVVLSRVLNEEILSDEYYALIEKRVDQDCLDFETDAEFYLHKQNRIALRHVSDDRVVAMIELVSPGNKASRNAIRSFVEKAVELLNQGIHLLIVDLFPPGSRDPRGIHAAIWEDLTSDEYTLPADRPLTLVSYESASSIRAFVSHVAFSEALPEMDLFLEPNGCVRVPLEATYQMSFGNMPPRWRGVMETAS